MSQLKRLTEIFIKDSAKFSLQLKRLDKLDKMTKKIKKYDPVRLDLYFDNNHPSRKNAYYSPYQMTDGDLRTHKEFDGQQDARTYVIKLAENKFEMTTQDLAGINAMVRGMKDAVDSEIFAPKPVRIMNPDRETFKYTGAKPEDFKEGLDYILDLANKNEANLHPFLLASLVHYLLVLLHPFSNGNGRTARMLITYIIKKYGYDLPHPAVEQYYVWSKFEYDMALNFNGDYYSESDLLKLDVHKWNGYLLKSFKEAYKLLLLAKYKCRFEAIKASFGLATPIHVPIHPVPENVELQVDYKYIKNYGEIGGVWAYTNEEGQVLTWLVKFKGTELNNFSKNYFTFQYFTNGKWLLSNLDFDLMPMYRLHMVKNSYADTYVICEGEKAAAAAAKMAKGTNYIAVSGHRGYPYIGKTDWAPLKGKNIIIWRDNDMTGKAAEMELLPILKGLDCNIRIIPDEALKDKKSKWDAADALEEGMTQSEFVDFVEKKSVKY